MNELPKIVSVEVDWLLKYGNRPHLKVVCSGTVRDSDFIFEANDDYYRAAVGPIVQIFAYINPGHGFGGNAFHIQMKDGTKKTLIGPWSGNSAGCNPRFPNHPEIVAAQVTCEDNNAWQTVAHHIEVNALVDFVNAHPELPFKMARIIGNDWYDEFPYEPVHLDPIRMKPCEDLDKLEIQIL